MGIVLINTSVLFFCEYMQFTFQLAFQSPDYRCCQNNIANGAKTYKEDFFQKEMFRAKLIINGKMKQSPADC